MSDFQDKNSYTGYEIAIIGLDGRFPGANDVNEFWENLIHEKDVTTRFTEQELLEAGVERSRINDPNYVASKNILSQTEYFDSNFFSYLPEEASHMDPQLRILHECVWRALEDASVNPYAYDYNIGLYLGINSNFNWEINSRLSSSSLDDFSLTLLRKRDYYATRLSYLLNLRGQSMMISTACSSSLVAVHLACQSLISGENDMVITGGIALSQLPDEGYIYQEGMILSKDGQCRPFNKNSTGTMEGEGIGVVVLKMLDEAIKDKDNIYAIIRGSSVNNDGNRKVGFTAPSVIGQTEVLHNAHRSAGLGPDDIQYIEAHGTGTPLGDQVELEALRQVFKNREKENKLYVGSVKSNIGHLDSAAGIAGLIKAVFVVKNKLIPATRNLNDPLKNPRNNSVQLVFNDKKIDLKHLSQPIIVGVSSLGIGGTNAHVVLQEPPEIESDNSTRRFNTLFFSARTQSALEREITDFHEKIPLLKSNKIEDVCYTLHSGRKSFEYRKFVICENFEDLEKTLAENNSSKIKSKLSVLRKPKLIFMFSGLAEPYVNIGWELYSTEQDFKENFDSCVEKIKRINGIDLYDILFNKIDSPQNIITKDIGIAQLVTFTLEYSIAKLLLGWGFKPDALIGYSFGDYAASCVSGLMSLEDTLQIIITRGKLIKCTSRGAMMSVPLPKDKVVKYLNNTLQVAIDNGDSCVISGLESEIHLLEEKLKADKIICFMLSSRYAIHSPVMKSILNEFQEKLQSYKFKESSIPVISFMDGEWLDITKNNCADYWCKHLSQEVNFFKGINNLTNEADAIFVEIGIGKDLCSLVNRLKSDNVKTTIDTIQDNRKEYPEDLYLVYCMAEIWLNGIAPDWSFFYKNESRKKLSLPKYSFDKIKYPKIKNPLKNLLESGKVNLQRRKPHVSEWFYYPTWKKAIFETTQISLDETGKCYVIFDNDECECTKLLQNVGVSSECIITVRISDGWERVSSLNYKIDPCNEEHTFKLFQNITEEKREFTRIINLWSYKSLDHEELDITSIQQFNIYNYYFLLNIAKAVTEYVLETGISIFNITYGLSDIFQDSEIHPEKSVILGAAKVIPLEYNQINVCCIDLEAKDEGLDENVEAITSILQSSHPEILISVRNNTSWVPYYEEIKLNISDNAIKLKQEGTYVITGGLGGMALTFTKYLTEIYNATIILIGRRDIPNSNEWEQYLEDKDNSVPGVTAIKELFLLKQKGAKIYYAQVDITQLEQLREQFDKFEDEIGKINGVIHAAGVADYGGVILKRSVQDSEDIFESKVYGSLVIGEIISEKQMDFFLLCSSIASYVPAFGQVGYASANIFMDYYAKYLKYHKNINAISINWDSWQEVGMAARAKSESRHEIDISHGIFPDEGFEIIQRVLSAEFENVIVSTRELKVLVSPPKIKSVDEEILDEAQNENTNFKERPQLKSKFVAAENMMEKKLEIIWQQKFGIKEIGVYDDYFELGGDSLLGLSFLKDYNRILGENLNIKIVFEATTIKQLDEYIKVNYPDKYRQIDKQIDVIRTSQIEKPIKIAEKKEYYELGSAQKRLFYETKITPDNTAYDMLYIYPIKGKVEVTKLEYIFNLMINRHKILRTSYTLINDLPAQIVHQDYQFKIRCFELEENGTDSKGLNFGDIVSLYEQSFDIEVAPLIKVAMIKIKNQREYLIINIPHIIIDGISQEIFIEEFKLLYEGAELEGVGTQFVDFVEWQHHLKNQKIFKTQQDFWLRLLRDQIPVLNLRTDFKRTPDMKNKGDNIDFIFEPKIANALRDLAIENNSTPFIITLSIYFILLNKLSNQNDLVIGCGVAGRTHSDLQSTLGMFVNIIPIRVGLNTRDSISSIINAVKDITLSAIENQDYPYEQMVSSLNLERTQNRNPLFDVAFNFQNKQKHKDRYLQDHSSDAVSYQKKTTKFELTLNILDIGDEFICSFAYSTELFEKKTIQKYVQYYIELCEAIAIQKVEKLEDTYFTLELPVNKHIIPDFDIGF